MNRYMAKLMMNAGNLSSMVTTVPPRMSVKPRSPIWIAVAHRKKPVMDTENTNTTHRIGHGLEERIGSQEKPQNSQKTQKAVEPLNFFQAIPHELLRTGQEIDNEAHHAFLPSRRIGNYADDGAQSYYERKER